MITPLQAIAIAAFLCICLFLIWAQKGYLRAGLATLCRLLWVIPILLGLMPKNVSESKTVTAGINDKVITAIEANQIVQDHYNKIVKIYPDVSLVFGGEGENTKESMNSLWNALVLSLIGIFALLVFLFNSFMRPVVIMSTIPLGLVGFSVAFVLHGRPISFLALIGIIGLGGIIVNSGIILISFIDHLRAENELTFEQTLARASRLRLRAVVVSSLTTISGLLPTAYGIGGMDAFLMPMTLAMAWGLTSGTILTLMWVPCAYAIVEDVGNLMGRLFRSYLEYTYTFGVSGSGHRFYNARDHGSIGGSGVAFNYPAVNDITLFTNNTSATKHSEFTPTGQIAIEAASSTVGIGVSGTNGLGEQATGKAKLVIKKDTADMNSNSIAFGLSINRMGADVAALLLGTDGSNNALYAANNSNLRFGKLSTDTFTELMVIDKTTGNVGINRPSPSAKLDVGGSIAVNGSVQHSSDRHFKKEITTIHDALDLLAQLKGKRFKWRVDEFPERNFVEGPDVGLIAQELEEVFPELVTTDDEGYKSIAYSKLVAVIIEAVKELRQEHSQDFSELKIENEMLKDYLCSKDPEAHLCMTYGKR